MRRILLAVRMALSMQWITILPGICSTIVSIRKKIPLFHGAVCGFYGQATTILPGQSACFACIFPKAPPVEIFPVIGVTPGIIGMIQATEVLKYLLNKGELLTDRLFIWDGITGAGRGNPYGEESPLSCVQFFVRNTG